MTIFEKTTLDSVQELLRNNDSSPKAVWENSIKKYTKRNSTIKKSCPKNTFNDLCNFGFIKGIPSNKAAELSINGQMAIEAIKILQLQNWKYKSKSNFWHKIFGKNHEGQLDVILLLKSKNFLRG